MTAMTRRLAAPRRGSQAATPCADIASVAPVERTEGRMATSAGRDERAALRREYAGIEAAAYAAIRFRV